MSQEHPARLASQKSRAAVMAKRKEDWLALFAPDAVIEDPIGKSPIDPVGDGHRGPAAISAFWDKQIEPVTIAFEVHHSWACGMECANVLTLTITMPNGMKALCNGVFTYKVNDEGKLVSLRGHWEFDQMMATFAPA
jgi:steroid delta-isomerase